MPVGIPLNLFALTAWALLASAGEWGWLAFSLAGCAVGTVLIQMVELWQLWQERSRLPRATAKERES